MQTVPYERLLVFEYEADGLMRLREDLSTYTDTLAVALYQPRLRITADEPGPITNLFNCWPVTQCMPASEVVSLIEGVPVEPALLDFDASTVLGSGWRGAETTPDGTTFQWMTATEATVPVQLDEGRAYRLDLRLVMALTDATLGSVQVLVNGVPIATQRTEGGLLLTGEIPAGVAARDIDRLELRVGQLDTVPGTDVQLGVALDFIALTPVDGAAVPAEGAP
jgi:hypothetical protein